MDNKTNKVRDLTLDAMAGLFIIIMMFQHYGIVTRAPLTIGHVFMYNTTWFFFKSGMFHHSVELNKETLTKLVRRLIIPFLFCSLFGVFISFLCSWILSGAPNFRILFGIFGQIIIYGAPWWNIPVWFLLTLFIVKIITAHYNGKRTSLYLFLAMVIFITHYIFSNTDRFNYIGNTAVATFFYILGYKTKDINFNTNMMYWIFGFLFLVVFFLYPSVFDIWANKPLYGNYILSILSVFLGIILINRIFTLCKFLHIKPLVFFGQNSMLFLVFHVPFYLAFCELLKTSGLTSNELNWSGAIFSILCCFSVCLFFDCNPRYKWIIGG